MRIFLFLLTFLLLPLTSCTSRTPADTVRVPILMYHDFTSDEISEDPYTIPIRQFEAHLTALAAAGYTSVTFADLMDFVYFGEELPEKPVLLTADDGYTAVAALAAPCAARYGMTISCAVIGALTDADGHFPMEEGVPENLEIVSHTFALHDRSGEDGMIGPGGFVPERLLTEDIAAMRTAFGGRYPLTASVLVYPHGRYSAESERIFRENGYSVTVTCDCGIAEIRRGDPESLYLLPRIAVWNSY
ncbi:MAG: polysaccharide deacetylase family protein [Clostridia bacterium]|nr:polysaccharide deacetylase family protein [Clostridia bacterium]